MPEQDNTKTVADALMNEVGLRTAVIGIGNAGSQLALAATRAGFNSFVMNTSDKDMADDVVGQDIKAFRIGDGRGSGMNRDIAQTLLNMNGADGIREIFENPYFTAAVEPSDVVFVTFSAGGGTGSGVGPIMADYIHRAYPSKVVIPYAVLPKMAESDQAHSNSIACVNDIEKIGVPFMLADLAFYENEPQDVTFKKVTDYVVETMKVIRGDYLRMSASGMIDERDMLTVVSEPGYMTIHMKKGITEPMLSDKTLQGYIIDQIKSSPAVRIQHDKLIQYSAVIANVNDSVQDPAKTGDFSELNNFVGVPRATYKNYAVSESMSEFEIFVISSGLTTPLDRTAAAKETVASRAASRNKRSSLNLDEARRATEVGGNAATRNIIMGSGQNQKANLSFLNGKK